MKVTDLPPKLQSAIGRTISKAKDHSDSLGRNDNISYLALYIYEALGLECPHPAIPPRNRDMTIYLYQEGCPICGAVFMRKEE